MAAIISGIWMQESKFYRNHNIADLKKFYTVQTICGKHFIQVVDISFQFNLILQDQDAEKM